MNDNIVKFPNSEKPESSNERDDNVYTDFGSALILVRHGNLVARRAWVNTQDQFIFYNPGGLQSVGALLTNSEFEAAKALREHFESETIDLVFRPALYKLTLFRHVEPWVPTDRDILARDWYLARVIPPTLPAS